MFWFAAAVYPPRHTLQVGSLANLWPSLRQSVLPFQPGDQLAQVGFAAADAALFEPHHEIASVNFSATRIQSAHAVFAHAVF